MVCRDARTGRRHITSEGNENSRIVQQGGCRHARSGAAFGAFAAEFALIEAAGGVVVNDCGQWLMIRRNGRWDLPKGHLECGERIEECAAREIEEETGCPRRGGATPVRYAACLLFPQDRTLGAETHPLVRAAYGILCPACASGRRGIEQVVWCTPAEVTRNLRDAFPTIRCVVAAMGKVARRRS